jgi:nucleotidyltransferase substrate binding protein (TIGR01987 family)
MSTPSKKLLTKRTQERFSSFEDSLKQLKTLQKQKIFSQIEKTGYIKLFELTFELSWNLQKSILEFEGNTTNIAGSRDVFRLSLGIEMIKNFDIWNSMIDDRNKSVHLYDQNQANLIFSKISTQYLKEFILLQETIKKLYVIT